MKEEREIDISRRELLLKALATAGIASIAPLLSLARAPEGVSY